MRNYISATYRRVFNISEIEQSRILQISAWVLLLGWYLQFSAWFRFSDFTTNAVIDGRHLCWPFFQSCGEYYFLSQYPYLNSHAFFYAFLFALLLAAAHALVTGRYGRAHVLFVLFFFWELLVMGMSMRLASNFWYFHIFYAALFLFTYQRIWHLQLGAVLLYIMSGFVKFDPGWTQGLYFLSLQEGLYGVPNTLVPWATNAVTVLEIVLAPLLLVKKRAVRLTVLALLALFHVYSVIYVGYLYPTIALLLVLTVFGLEEKRGAAPRTGTSVVGVLLLAGFIFIHLVPLFIEGGARYTGEGNKFGMYMFEANYQCDANITITYTDNTTEERSSVTTHPNKRCDPYAYWFYFVHGICDQKTVRQVSWTHDVSWNGSPFMRIVDEPNACSLSYTPFEHNDWIRIIGTDSVPAIRESEPNRYPIPRF